MRATCRACGATGLHPILDLGAMPLVNALPTHLGQHEARFPLELCFCAACSLVQIGDDVPPEQLFSDYTYFSSYSDTMVRHVETLAKRLIAERGLGQKSQVVEIASNDGYLLQHYQKAGVPVLGIEPAANVAEVARRERGIPTRTEFFGDRVAQALRDEGIRADVIHAHNVLAHVPDLPGFLRGIANLLAEDGIACIEAPHVVTMVDHCEFDTIYHEHLCYFSLTALVPLFARHGLSIHAVEKVAIHGGSLRLFASRAGRMAAQPSVARLLAEEKAWGVDQLSRYLTLAREAASVRDALRETVAQLRRDGKRIAAYGASAKGCVLLNYAGLDGDSVDFVVDRSPHKQGRFLPGVGVPISAPERLLTDMPDHVLLLVWNLTEEVMAQQAEYRSRGGSFIVPAPKLRVIA